MSENFNFFLPLSKIDKEKRTVSGYASTPAVDLDGEVVTLDAVKAALPGYWQWRNIRRMHTNDAVGVAKEANIDEKGLFLTAKIVDDDAWQKCQEGVYKGFSIGGRKLEKSGKTITKIDLIEISVVDRPANPECKFDVNKLSKSGPAFLLPAPKKRSQVQAEALSKMSQVVDMLAQEPEEEEAEITTQKSLAPVEEIRREVEKAAEKKARKIAKKEKRKEAMLAFWEGDTSFKPPIKILESTELPLLALNVDDGAEAVEGKVGLSHGLDLEPSVLGLQKGSNRTQFTKKEYKLLKSMGVAGSLSYCFDSIRSAQRSLILEGKREGGDKKDSALARKLGVIANDLAMVIGQKAEHEGAEALDLSDADDQGLLSILGERGFEMSEKSNLGGKDDLTKMVLEILAKSSEDPKAIFKTAKENLKKVKEMRREAAECVKGAFEMHKAAYLAKQALVKAGKVKPEEIEKGFDHAGVMKVLQKAYGALTTQKTFTKAAGENLAKAAGRISAGGAGVEDSVSGVYSPPTGLETISPSEMSNLPAHKGTKSDGMITPQHAEALVRAATAEAESRLLKAMPAVGNGRKPYSFDVSRLGLTTGTTDGETPDASAALLFKGANVANLTSDDEAIRTRELAKAIGNRIMTPGGGKTVFDPSFHGTAGGTA